MNINNFNEENIINYLKKKSNQKEFVKYIDLDFLDRLKLLFKGRLVIRGYVYTEKESGLVSEEINIVEIINRV